MKKTAWLLLPALLAVSCVLYLAVHLFAENHLIASSKSENTTCRQIGKVHNATIRNGIVTPVHTTAKRCDKLVITNLDDRIRLMAFGIHENHQAYDGIVERPLEKGQSLTITFNKTGSFKFHDHIDDQAQGTFTITK